jgi:signal transduction histidine kinase/ActR/RegA family two-component response regulator
MAFYQRNIKNIDSGWTVSTENKKIGDDQSIPQDYSTGTDKYLTLTRNLPGNVEDSDYLLILTNYQKVNVTINGQNIYTYNGVYGFLSDYSPNKEYLLVPMKGIYSNQPISITYNAAMHRYTGRIGTVSLGNKSDLIFQLISQKIIVIISGAITVLFGLFFMIYKLNPKNLESSYFYLGIFTFFLGIWYMAQSGVNQVFFDNVPLFRAIEFFSLMMIPIPAILFVNQLEEHKFQKLASVLVHINLVLTILEGILILVFKFYYSDVVWITHAMLVTLLLFAFITIIMIMMRYNDLFSNIKWFLIGLVALVLGGTPSLITFYTLPSSYSNTIMSVALLTFLYCSVRWAISHVSNEFRNREVAVQESAAKSGFLANMSHEIRTPINAIIGLNALIAKRTRDSKIYSYSSDMDIAGRKLLTTVNDILLYSKLDSGKLTLIPEVYDTSDMIADIREEMNDILKDKPIKFTITYHPSIPSSMYGDLPRIKIILMNLLRNAYKYTESGYISLHFSGEIKNDSTFILRAVVADTGCGISPDAIATLYEPFEHNNDQEGTGLGLPLVKMLVTLMGGNIEQSSSPGGGSSFYVTMPQRIFSYKPMGVDAKIEKKHENNADTVKEFNKDAKILFADDNRVNLTVFKGLMNDTGIIPDTVTSGSAAVEMASKTHYDIIFLDYLMPEMNGVETLQAIRSNPKNASYNTPAIVLTAGTEGNDKDMLLSNGFAEYLEKPLEKSRLIRVLDHMLVKEDKS